MNRNISMVIYRQFQTILENWKVVYIMKTERYLVTIIDNGSENTYHTNSRNATKHLRDHGGNRAIVTTKQGKTVSAAEYSQEFGFYRIAV